MQQFRPDGSPPAPLPLPADFLAARAEHDEVLVSSRDAFRSGTVPVWFVIGPPGVVYLFAQTFSTKVQRWLTDPWTRLSVPGTQHAVEGRVRFMRPDEIDPIADAVVERWSMQGATTVEGLKRTLRDRVHTLVRIEGSGANYDR
ncbi:MAG: hypothetical protein NVSMB2_02500 [Chloroflexota bacterium]